MKCHWFNGIGQIILSKEIKSIKSDFAMFSCCSLYVIKLHCYKKRITKYTDAHSHHWSVHPVLLQCPEHFHNSASELNSRRNHMPCMSLAMALICKAGFSG